MQTMEIFNIDDGDIYCRLWRPLMQIMEIFNVDDVDI